VLAALNVRIMFWCRNFAPLPDNVNHLALTEFVLSFEKRGDGDK
jgi:hypothetical protein